MTGIDIHMCYTYTIDMGHRGPHHHGPRRRGISRTRHRSSDGSWTVDARLERFNEAVVLSLLESGAAHGYELADALRTWVPDQQIDLGNLYRMLRSMEDDGIVRSEWSRGDVGRAKRTYELTDDGIQLLDAWIESLRITNETIAGFLNEHGERK